MPVRGGRPPLAGGQRVEVDGDDLPLTTHADVGVALAVRAGDDQLGALRAQLVAGLLQDDPHDLVGV
jgi:hypothetical protein